MKSFGVGAVLWLLLVAQVWSAPPTVEELQQLGGKVVEVKGVITEFSGDIQKFTAAEFRLIGACTSLKKLGLNGKTLTDDTLPLLAGLTSLEELNTNGSQLSDAAYKHFAQFPNLKVLYLWHPSWDLASFTGTGLAELKQLPKLERLIFAGATTGDTALAAIGQITQLKEFQTWHTMQTNAGNVHLTNLVNLQTLKMGQRLPKWGKTPAPSFDATTIPVLVKLPSLEKLELFEAVFTAQDLLPLKDAKQLKTLKIHTTEISAEDIEKLRPALPQVKIDFEPITPENRQATLQQKLKLLPPQGATSQ